jgi:hypothetical protein
MLKRDPRSYAISLINKFENEFGIDVFVDYITYQPYEWFGVSTGDYWVENGETTVYIPKTRCKRTQEEILFHELGHAIVTNYSIPKYITNLIGNFDYENQLSYRIKCIRYLYKQRPEGMCSGYSLTNTEEEFAELISFVVCNRKRKRWYDFDGERIDLWKDSLLTKKVEAIKRFLRIN